MKNKILCIILVIPCITYIFLHAYHVKIIDGNQLSFIGAILGGLITLGGVWWTIKDMEEKRKEDMHNSHKPFLEISPKTPKYSPNDFCFNSKWQMKIFIKYDDKESHFKAVNNTFLTTIKLKNVGLGIAKNIIFTDFDYQFTEIMDINSFKTPKNLPFELTVTYLYAMPYLLNNKFEEIPIIFFTTPNCTSKNIPKKCSLTGSMKISYSDCYNNWFSQKLNFSFILEYYPSTGISINSDYIYLEDAKTEKNMQYLFDKIYQTKTQEYFEYDE